MGTTAEKLTYLNTTKQKIKDAINNIGGNITSETTFRQYVAALESIYQSMPKVSGSGTSLSLTPTLKGLMQIDLKGNTYQEQLTGKNLFKNIPTTETKQNIVMANDGTSISFVGNNTSTYYPMFIFYANGDVITSNWWVDENSIKDEKGYFTASQTNNVISLIKSGTITTGTIMRCVIGFETIVNTINIDNATDVYTKNITTINQRINFIAIGCSSNQNVNVNLKIQIEQGTTATTYEQYCGGVPSPNPSYPQDIHNVSRNNNIVVCGKNLFDKDNAIDNYRITQTGTPYSDNIYYISPYIKVIPNTQYTKNSPIADAYHRYAFYEDSNTDSFIGVSSDNTITTPSNCKYIRFCGAKTEKDTTMLVVGNEIPTTYEAYNGTTYPINLPNGMELCKIGTYQDYFYKENDKWYLHKEIGKVVLNGSESWSYPSANRFNVDGAVPNNNYDRTSLPTYYCDKYKGYDKTDNNGAFNTLVANESYGFNFTNNPNNNTIRFKDTRYTSLDDFKAYLSNDNLGIYYALLTPTFTEITDTTLISQLEAIKSAKSKNGTTNINQENNDLPFILDVSALLGSES